MVCRINAQSPTRGSEANRVLLEMEKHGLRRGAQGLRIFMMCEIPSSVMLADQFARRFDGFSIGSNDPTQLVLGINHRDSRISSRSATRHRSTAQPSPADGTVFSDSL